MRIIGGAYRSRILKTPPGSATRPTSGIVRETLGNILMTVLADATVLDLFAGSGSVGLELLSRGAAHVVYVEQARPALHCLRTNIADIGVAANTEVVALPVERALDQFATAHRQYDIIFLDPPFADAEAYRRVLEAVASSHLLAGDGILVAQHDTRQHIPENAGALQQYRVKQIGDNTLSFYRLSPTD